MRPNIPVKEARIRRLLKMQELATAAGVSYGTVYRAEHGLSVGDLSQEKIARALGIEDRRELFPEPDEAA